MNERAHSEMERLEELLVDRATIGLSIGEAAELELLMRALGIEDDNSFDLTAAAIDAAVASEQSELLPDRLRRSAIESASNFFDNENSDSSSGSPKDKQVSIDRTVSLPEKSTFAFSRRDLFSILVVAASLIAAVFIWFGQTDELPLSVAQRYEQFLNEPPADMVQIKWSSSGQPSGENVEGDVKWSNETQAGFMTFKGLAKNDPSVEQYQLWIFDKKRDEKYPVDGGVFDVANSAEETVIAIDAKINVSEATLFAITIEQPGGVVVSDRKRLPVVAAVE
jgi:hypothetical protein